MLLALLLLLLQVEQAYCQGSRGSFRLQVINGSAWIAGETPSFESRLLNLKRQLLHLYLEGHLPEGIDVSSWPHGGGVLSTRVIIADG